MTGLTGLQGYLVRLKESVLSGWPKLGRQKASWWKKKTTFPQQGAATMFGQWNTGRMAALTHPWVLGMKQEGKGQGTITKRLTQPLRKTGQGINWLEPTRSTMVEDSLSSGP